MNTAMKYDEIRANTPKDKRHELGPLFGIPISIKDSIEQRGLDCTSGLVEVPAINNN